MTKVPNFLPAQKGMLENRINDNSGYRRGNWQVQNNKPSKEFERSSLEIKKNSPYYSEHTLFKKKVSINNLNHFQCYSNLFSPVDHLSIIPSGICMKHLFKIAPFLIGPVSLKQMAKGGILEDTF